MLLRHKYGRHLDAALSAFAGCSLAAFLAKWAIMTALSDLKALSRKVASISEHLAEISVRLEKLGEHDSVLKEHTIKIAQIECETKSKRVM